MQDRSTGLLICTHAHLGTKNSLLPLRFPLSHCLHLQCFNLPAFSGSQSYLPPTVTTEPMVPGIHHTWSEIKSGPFLHGLCLHNHISVSLFICIHLFHKYFLGASKYEEYFWVRDTNCNSAYTPRGEGEGHVTVSRNRVYGKCYKANWTNRTHILYTLHVKKNQKPKT